jgi:hypothetical protein
MTSEYDENAQNNLSGWQKTAIAGNDHLANYQGKPILGQRANKRYVGRVVVELWETGQPVDDSQQIVFTADATDGNHGALLRRIASALLKRVQKGPTF